ncbi:MAG: ABC transporter substrate-binding protein [Aristaeellaceae bacterium]
MKKLVSLLLAAVMLLFLCSFASAEEKYVAEEVSIALGYDVSDLAPWSSATSGRLNLMPTLYEYMAYYDSSEECGMGGILMQSFEKVDDRTSRITIYDYIYDSAGNHMTASDIAFCFNTWKENGKSVKCKLLESAVAISDYTVEITLTTDAVGELENMMCGLIPIVTQAAYEASGDGMIENVVSTSPYKLVEYVSGSRIVAEKRDDYWQTDASKIMPVSQANVKKITWNIIGEPSQMAINLETNAVDITTALAYSEAQRFMEGGASAAGHKVFSAVSGNFWWLTFNCSEGGMFENNQALRQAICYGIDTQGVIDGVLFGEGNTMSAYGNRICVDYNTAWDSEPYYEFDLAKAQELLAQSGFDTSRTIRIMCPSTDTDKKTVQVLQAYLMQLGLKAELCIYDSALFQSYKTDASQWDIMVDSKQSVDYVTALASTLNAETPAMNFVQDDKLQEMVTSIVVVNGHTTEAINEYMEYVKDQAYVYALFVPYNFVAAEDAIEEAFLNFKGWLVPGACTYSENFVR